MLTCLICIGNKTRFSNKKITKLKDIFRQVLLKFGIWDQIRVDHGREFFLMLKIQEDLQNLRFNLNRDCYVQSTSRMVS